VSARILQGDCREVMATLPEASIDAIVSDPPYELGFMGKGWDRTGVANDVETWRQALRVLKPGGHLLAFSGTRTYHRMTCAIEDAGFEVRDQIGWLYGSGFPKSRNLDGQWQGWGTALKPAWEPICMARKPLVGTVAENVQRFGTGAINVDGCRVDAHDGASTARNPSMVLDTAAGFGKGQAMGGNGSDLGRWPANIIHDGSEEVIAAFPQAAGQSGPIRGTEPSVPAKGDVCYGFRDRVPFEKRGDSGSAARFFYTAKASRHDRNDGLSGMPKKAVNWSSGTQSPGTFQSPNTEREQRNHHPTVKPTDLMRYLCRLVTPPGGTVLDPFMGSGSTLKAAELEGFDAIGIELDPAYIEIARRRIASDAPLFADTSTT
jgi:site-specific DNA-methyltransferase (adenine-specific)